MNNTTTPSGHAQVSVRGIDLVASFEGFRSDAYQDQVGVWTVGFGETWLGARRVQKGDHLNRAEALARLQDRLNRDFAPGVAAACGAGLAKLNQAQFDACCSLAYNIGTAGFAGSTVARKIAAGDLEGAADAFRLWNKAGGRVLPGLVARRAAERQVFLKGYGS
jgi:lysozyme